MSHKKTLVKKTRDFKKLLVVSALSLSLTAAALPIITEKAHATATILIPTQVVQAGTTIASIAEYYKMLEQWQNKLSDFLSEFGLDEWIQIRIGFENQRSEELYYGERTANRLLFGEIDQNSGKPINIGHYQRSLLNIVIDDSGQFNADAVEKILPPPQPPLSGDLTEEDINAIRDHAKIISMETYTEPAPAKDLNTSYGAEYELERIAYIQQQLLAQDSIKQYPMHAGIIKSQSDKALALTKSSEGKDTNAATLLSLQVMAQAEISGQTSLFILESNLRQERLLGALLAIKAKEHHLEKLDTLNRSEFR